MKEDWKTLLSDEFQAPQPKHKKEFLRNLRAREVSMPEMLLQQVAYVRPAIWLFALALVAIAIGGSLMRVETTVNVLTMLMPFSAAIAVLETRRSERCGMAELEMTTRFSLRSVVLARMMIVGIVSFLILCISSPMIAAAFDAGTVLTAVRILIPYLITMSISLLAERSPLGRKTGYASLAIASGVSIIIYWIDNYEPNVVANYLGMIDSWGIMIALGLMAFTAVEQWKTINGVEAFA